MPGVYLKNNHQLLITDFSLLFRNIRQPTRCLSILSDSALKALRSGLNFDWTSPVWRGHCQGYSRGKYTKNVLQWSEPTNVNCKTWISDKTWQVIVQRKLLKMRVNDKDKYSHLFKETKRRCRKDKEQYVTGICKEIESHGLHNESRDLFRKVKILVRLLKYKKRKTEYNQGKIIKDSEQILEVWKNYCVQLYEQRGRR